jgi:hypothetical protein
LNSQQMYPRKASFINGDYMSRESFESCLVECYHQ